MSEHDKQEMIDRLFNEHEVGIRVMEETVKNIDRRLGRMEVSNYIIVGTIAAGTIKLIVG